MRLGFAAAATVLVALAIAACGTEAPGDGEGNLDGEITVSNHPSLLYSPPWIAALDQDLFAKHGLEVNDIVGSEGGGTTVQNVVSGGLPIGEVATSAAVTAFLAGADIKIVGGGVASGEDVFWVTGPDSDIDSIEDLEGKEVGYTSPGSVTQGLLALIAGALRRRRRQRQDARHGRAPRGPDRAQAAATSTPPRCSSPIFSEQVDEEGWKPIFRASDHVPEFMSTVIITGPGRGGEEPGARARDARPRGRRASTYVASNPEQVAKAWAKEAEIKPASAMKALESVDPDVHWKVGLGKPEGLEAVLETMRLIDLLGNDQEVDWDELVDQQFIPEADRGPLPETK